jgi:hypothetical protein
MDNQMLNWSSPGTGSVGIRRDHWFCKSVASLDSCIVIVHLRFQHLLIPLYGVLEWVSLFPSTRFAKVRSNWSTRARFDLNCPQEFVRAKLAAKAQKRSAKGSELAFPPHDGSAGSAPLIAFAPPPVTITCKSGDDLNHIEDNKIDVVVMDPPYYDNVMYAEISDFFYVWLKRTAGYIEPSLFRRRLTDKDHEAVANVARFKGQKGAKVLAGRDYQERMAAIFAECRRVLKPSGVLTLMFTHKATGAWDVPTAIERDLLRFMPDNDMPARLEKADAVDPLIKTPASPDGDGLEPVEQRRLLWGYIKYAPSFDRPGAERVGEPRLQSSHGRIRSKPSNVCTASGHRSCSSLMRSAWVRRSRRDCFCGRPGWLDVPRGYSFLPRRAY